MGDLSKHFNRAEFACQCGCGFDTVDTKLLEILEELRSNIGKIYVNSGCRCFAHNASVGGSKSSQHLYGRAADIVCTAHDSDFVYKWLDDRYPNKLGLGKYPGWVHIDTRTKRVPARW